MAITWVRNARNISDAALIETKALPAAAATNYTDAIDLGQTVGGTLEGVEMVLNAPAVANLVDDKTIIYTVADSADNSSFTALSAVATVTQTGASSAGAAASEMRFKLPAGCRRYVRVGATVLTGGGDNTGSSYSLTLLV
jgi:hypothetical protein